MKPEPLPNRWSNTSYGEFKMIVLEEFDYQSIRAFILDIDGLSLASVGSWSQYGRVPKLVMTVIELMRRQREARRLTMQQQTRLKTRAKEGIKMYFHYNGKRKVSSKEIAEVFGHKESEIIAICDELASEGHLK